MPGALKGLALIFYSVSASFLPFPLSLGGLSPLLKNPLPPSPPVTTATLLSAALHPPAQFLRHPPHSASEVPRCADEKDSFSPSPPSPQHVCYHVLWRQPHSTSRNTGSDLLAAVLFRHPARPPTAMAIIPIPPRPSLLPLQAPRPPLS